MKSVSMEIKKTHNCLRRYTEAQIAETIQSDLTGMQGMIIGYIYVKSICEGHDIYQRDIEKRFSVRRSTATVILQALEKKGYLTKENVEHDARLKKIILSQKAIDMQKSLDPIFYNAEQKAIEGIAQEDLEVLMTVLEKIRNNVKNII